MSYNIRDEVIDTIQSKFNLCRTDAIEYINDRTLDWLLIQVSDKTERIFDELKSENNYIMSIIRDLKDDFEFAKERGFL